MSTLPALPKSQALRQYEQRQAEAEVGGIASAAELVASVSDRNLGAQAVLDAISAQAQRVNIGDLRGIEAQLVANVALLDALCARYIAKADEAPSPRVEERFFNMAIRAKSQSLRAIEALTTLKSGPLVIAKQVNVAGGPQQINNHPPRADGDKDE